MRAGPLRHRVELQRSVPIRSETGAQVEDWQPWLEVWAEVTPLSPREQIAAQQVLADVTTKIRIRYRPGLDAKLRVLFMNGQPERDAAQIFDVEGPPIETDAGRTEVWLMCRRREADGFRSGTE